MVYLVILNIKFCQVIISVKTKRINLETKQYKKKKEELFDVVWGCHSSRNSCHQTFFWLLNVSLWGIFKWRQNSGWKRTFRKTCLTIDAFHSFPLLLSLPLLDTSDVNNYCTLKRLHDVISGTPPLPIKSKWVSSLGRWWDINGKYSSVGWIY